MREMTVGGIKIRGTSTAGMMTSIHVPRLKAVFDAGVAHPSFSKERNIFLSHCHMDHIGALMALLGYRELNGLEPAIIWCPPTVVDRVTTLISVAASLGKFKQKAAVRAMSSDGGTYAQRYNVLL